MNCYRGLPPYIPGTDPEYVELDRLTEEAVQKDIVRAEENEKKEREELDLE